MLELKKIFALLAIAGALVVTGCDDEKSGGGKDGAVVDDADVQEDATVNDDAEVVVEGACVNADDADAIGPFGDEVETYGDANNKSISGVATDCAVAAALGMGLEGDAARAYVQTCILEKSDDAISDECSGCFAASAECAIANCFSPCAMAPIGASDECIACRCENNCYQDYGACSGREYGDQCD